MAVAPRVSPMDALRSNIRRIAAEREMSLAAVARAAGMHRVYLHKILAGQHVPSIDFADRIASALGVDFIDLFVA